MNLAKSTISAFTAAAVLTVFIALSPAQGQTVTFGNMGPGIEPRPSFTFGDIFSGIDTGQWAAVAVETGSSPLSITSVDLGLSLASGSAAGLFISLSDQDFQSPNPPPTSVLTFSTTQTLTGDSVNPEKITFTPDASFTLQPNTTYFLRLGWDLSGGSVNWHRTAAGSPEVLSDYSNYALAYGSYSGFPNVDEGAYFVTASVVPEASTAGLMILGGAVLAGLVHRSRRRKAQTN
jgi:hypothetical protein